jgi:hypothetical protein
LVDEPYFQSWLKCDESLLYISGNPGSGKTFLASAVISLLQSKIVEAPDSWHGAAVGFYFIRKDDTHCRAGGFHQALRDVSWQLTRFDPNYTDHVASQCRSCADIETLPAVWRKLFTSYFRMPGCLLYLILDGIDEAQEESDYGRRSFLKLISDIAGINYNQFWRPESAYGLHFVITLSWGRIR